MKIDFNGQEMTIKFDKVPKFLYFNEENRGVGKIFFNGIQRKGLQDVKIQAHTAESGGFPDLKYRVQYIDKDLSYESQYIGNMKEGLNLEEIISILDIIKKIVNDERVPIEIKDECFNIFKEFTSRFEKGEKI